MMYAFMLEKVNLCFIQYSKLQYYITSPFLNDYHDRKSFSILLAVSSKAFPVDLMRRKAFIDIK